MDKKDVIVIHTKKDKTSTRGFLLKRNTSFEPFVVCSNYRELEDGTITWDWGHYTNNIMEALIVMYESELGLEHKQSYEIIEQLGNKIASDNAIAIVNKLNEFIDNL